MKNNNKINFQGNIEPQYFMDGNTDVIISGGFEGNLMGKTAEGMANSMSIVMKREFTKNPKRILGAILLRKALKEVKKTFDNRESGGAIIVGVNGVAIKTHGSCDSFALYKSFELADKLVTNDIINIMKKEVGN
jgi:glycerol-3-phosphate acyltransferase PlsX